MNSPQKSFNYNDFVHTAWVFGISLAANIAFTILTVAVSAVLQSNQSATYTDSVFLNTFIVQTIATIGYGIKRYLDDNRKK